MTQIMEYAGDLITHVHIADSFDHTASSGLRYIVNPPARPHAFISIWISSRARSTGTTSSPAWPGSGSTARHRVRIRLGRPRARILLGQAGKAGAVPGQALLKARRSRLPWRARTWRHRSILSCEEVLDAQLRLPRPRLLRLALHRGLVALQVLVHRLGATGSDDMPDHPCHGGGRRPIPVIFAGQQATCVRPCPAVRSRHRNASLLILKSSLLILRSDVRNNALSW